MSDWLGTATGALGALGKGAAMGAALGPVGAAAGGALGLAMNLLPGAAHLFGADDATAAKVVQTVAAVTGSSDPVAQAAAVSDPQVAADLRVQLSQIAADQQAAQLADVANARQQTVTLAQGGSKIAWGAPVISIVVVAGFFGAFAALMWVQAIDDAGVSAMINMMTGGLVAGLSTVLSYWLGSSAGSARKTELMAATTPAAPEPNAASESK